MIEVGNFLICAKDGDYAVYEVVGFDDEDLEVSYVEVSSHEVDFTRHKPDHDWEWDMMLSYPDTRLLSPQGDILVGVYTSRSDLERAVEPIRSAHAAMKKTVHEADLTFKIAQARHRNAVEKAKETFDVMVKLCRQHIEFEE